VASTKREVDIARDGTTQLLGEPQDPILHFISDLGFAHRHGDLSVYIPLQSSS
jgi:hypothetical protein